MLLYEYIEKLQPQYENGFPKLGCIKCRVALLWVIEETGYLVIYTVMKGTQVKMLKFILTTTTSILI